MAVQLWSVVDNADTSSLSPLQLACAVMNDDAVTRVPSVTLSIPSALS